MPEFYALKGFRVAEAQYDEEKDEVQILFNTRNNDKIALTFPRSIGPVVCQAIVATAAKAPDHKKEGQQGFQPLLYEGMELLVDLKGNPAISFLSKDGGRLLIGVTESTPADLRNLASELEKLLQSPPKQLLS